MLNLAQRTTTDIVVLILVLLVSIILVILCAGALTFRMMHPNIEIAALSESVSQTIATIVGALVGFIGGRAYGKYETETNGKETKP